MPLDLKVRTGETRTEFTKRVTAEYREAQNDRRKEFAAGKIPCVMDVDDFGFLLPGYDDLLNLKKTYPGFKITAFTIPLPKEFFGKENVKHFKTAKYREWANIVNQEGWIEVAIHGFAHTHNEMEISYSKAITLLTATENFFEEIGLKYVKIFKAPYWQYSYDALVALRDKGYLVAIDRNHPRPVPEGLETYLYNWSFEEPPPNVPVLKGHGHFTGRNTNNIKDTFPNITHYIPRGTKFMTIGEYHKTYGKDTEAHEVGPSRGGAGSVITPTTSDGRSDA